MKIKQALQEYLLEIEIRKYTQKTILSYRNNLNLFVQYLTEEDDTFGTENLHHLFLLQTYKKQPLSILESGCF